MNTPAAKRGLGFLSELVEASKPKKSNIEKGVILNLLVG